MVANIAWLGPEPERSAGQRATSILLVHHKDKGWQSSQFNAITLAPPWSAFRLPHPHGTSHPLELDSTAGQPFVHLSLQRSGHPCTSQCAPFGQWQYLRWQSEPGVLAEGEWGVDGQVYRDVRAVGYHERVRGFWGWPELGCWVFGFANDPAQRKSDSPPPYAVVFTLIQPPSPPSAATGSMMIWREGRLVRHFPRRDVSVAARGLLDRDKVQQVPELANLSGTPPMASIPRRLLIVARMGSDWAVLDFRCDEAARMVIPSETSLTPFSVHEVIGPACVEGCLAGKSFCFETNGIVEFAGGAIPDPAVKDTDGRG
jgi:hypothetical protein